MDEAIFLKLVALFHPLYLSLDKPGRTRVHLDTVEALGEFMELEVVLDDDEPSEAGVEVAMRLMQKLGIHPSSLIEGAYLDLLQASR